MIKAISAEFPVFELGADIFRLVCNSCKVDELNTKLSEGIAINRNKVPMGYIPFDENSYDSEVAPLVMQTIISFASQNKPHFKIEEITAGAIGSLWEHFGPPCKKRLKKN